MTARASASQADNNIVAQGREWLRRHRNRSVDSSWLEADADTIIDGLLSRMDRLAYLIPDSSDLDARAQELLEQHGTHLLDTVRDLLTKLDAAQQERDRLFDQKFSQGVRAGQLLGAEFDGASLEEVAQALVTAQQERDKAVKVRNDIEEGCQVAYKLFQQEAASLKAQVAPTEHALSDCYMMSKREIARILNGKSSTDVTSLERWQHVNRFCEEAGQRSSVLRAEKTGLVLGVYRCKVCGARWLLWPDVGLWDLLDGQQRPGSCCDNAPMGDQIEHLRDIPLTVKTTLPSPIPTPKENQPL